MEMIEKAFSRNSHEWIANDYFYNRFLNDYFNMCFLYSAIVQTSIINTSTWSHNITKRQIWFEGRLPNRSSVLLLIILLYKLIYDATNQFD